MKDTTSLVALSLASGRVVGVAVARINSDSDKTDTYNRVQVRCHANINSAVGMKPEEKKKTIIKNLLLPI